MNRAALAASVAALTAAATPAWAASPPGDPSRVYEMVSAVDKNFGEVQRVLPVLDDGDTAVYISTAVPGDVAGLFKGGFTLARRGGGGWSQAAFSAPSAFTDRELIAESQIFQVAQDRRSALIETEAPLDEQDRDGRRDPWIFTLDGAPASWLARPVTLPDTAAASMETVWASPDLRHAVMQGTFGHSPLAAGPDGSEPALYERLPSGAHRLVSVLPDGTPSPSGSAGSTAAAYSGLHSRPDGLAALPDGGSRAVSDDGRRIYFRASASNAAMAPLYLREDGMRTIAVSASERQADAGTVLGADFVAASADGAMAYFIATAPLTEDATGAGLYRFDRLAEPGQRLTLLGNGAILEAVASRDMGAVYFRSRAVLAPGAVNNRQNVYVRDRDGLRLVVTGTAATTIARVSPNGRYAVLQSTASHGAAPNAGKHALYLYDAVTKAVACVSCRPDGSPSTANTHAAPDLPIAPFNDGQMAPRLVTDDGRAFFQTAERLAPQDLNDVADVYEYAAGERRLLSSGTSISDSYLADVTEDARSVFLFTRSPLVPEDIDNGALDLYVARVGGGVPRTSERTTACAGDACQGPAPSAPALPGAPASQQTGPPENVVESHSPETVLQLQSVPAEVRRRLARRGRANLTVLATAGTTVELRARGRVRGKQRTVGTGRRTLRGSGTMRANVELRLTSAARRELRRRGRLPIRIDVRVKGAPTRRTSLTLEGAK